MAWTQRDQERSAGIVDQTHISWQDTTWLSMNYLGPQSALDYFSNSPFYQTPCNNEMCKMQGLDPTVALKTMTGVEYVLDTLPPEPPPPVPLPVGAPPPPRRLFVVKKQFRRGRNRAEVQGVYYIMDGTIFQCPTALSLVSSRLQKTAFLLEEGFKELTQLPELNARGGYDWEWNKKALIAWEKEQRQLAKQPLDGETAPKAVINEILIDLVKKYHPEGDAPKRSLEASVDGS